MAFRIPCSFPTLSALLVCLSLAACGQEAERAAPDPQAAPEQPLQISGMYKVKGLTTVIGTDQSREIHGSLILAQDGDTWTATFDLETMYPGPDGEVPAEVVGNGGGKLVGNRLEGTAKTQIVASRVPGLDSHFIMVPPAFGVRIVSEGTGELKPDGTLEFTMENRGAEGEEYVPTRTTVSGVRSEKEAPAPHAASD